MFRAGAEVEAEAIIRTANFDPLDRPTIQQLSLAHLGTRPAFGDIQAEAQLVWIEGQPQIVVREGTPPPRARFLASHELAEWWCLDWPQVPELERWCNAIAAALVAPRRVFRQVYRRRGGDVHAVARDLGTTQSVALLRVGETLGRPVAVVRERGPLVRGQRWRWPRMSHRDHRPPPGTRSVLISDEPARHGFVVA